MNRTRRKEKCHGTILKRCFPALPMMLIITRTKHQRKTTLLYSTMLSIRDLHTVAVWVPIIIMVIRYVRYIQLPGWCVMLSINILIGMLISPHCVFGRLCKKLVSHVLQHVMNCWIPGIRYWWRNLFPLWCFPMQENRRKRWVVCHVGYLLLCVILRERSVV